MHRLIAPFLATLLVVPAALARNRHNFDVTISTDDAAEEITRCDQIRVTIAGEPAVRAEEQIDARSLRSLKVTSGANGGVHVSGWDGPGYAITACKAAATASDLAALRPSLRGNELTAESDEQAIIYFLVRAPRGADLDLHATNGEVSVHNIEGTINATTENGPIAIRNCSGSITADAQNGPIGFAGDSGTVKLAATNGPISVKLAGATWNGSLDAHTDNGPLSLKVPRAYRSGVVVESDGHSPFACRAEACSSRSKATSDDDDDAAFSPRRLEIGSGPAVVRLSSHNGPVSVKNSD